MVKLVCQNCGQVWYSAYAGGSCDTCGGNLKQEALEQKIDTRGEGNLVYLPSRPKRAKGFPVK